MDALMLDTHDDRPPGVLPVDWRGQRRFIDDRQHRLAHLGAIGQYVRHARPVVVGVVEIIPTHLIHAHSEDGFQLLVDTPIKQPCQQQFVGEKGSGVPEIKNQRVTQVDRFGIEGLGIRQTVKQSGIAVEGADKVVAQTGAQHLGLRLVQPWCASEKSGGTLRGRSGGSVLRHDHLRVQSLDKIQKHRRLSNINLA